MDLPFTLTQRPRCNDPQRYHKHKQHGARTYCHQCFQNESITRKRANNWTGKEYLRVPLNTSSRTVFQSMATMQWILCVGTYLVLKLIRFNAPMLRDDASVNNFECNSMTRHIRYKRRNIGNDRATSYGTIALPIALFLFANFVVHSK